MFNLDYTISVWRQKMAAGEIKDAAVLDELESHLREDVERQMRAGALKEEFRKTEGRSKASERLMILAGVGFVGFILWMSGFTFFRTEWSSGERAMAFVAIGLTLLVTCGWRYAVPFVPLFPTRGKRMIIAGLCVAAGCGISNFLCTSVLPRFERGDHELSAIGMWVAFVIAFFWCLGLAFAMSSEDREHWGMNKRPTTMARE